MRSPAQVLPPLVAAVLLLATVVQALAAVRAFKPVGSDPGASPLALDVAVVAGLFALATAALLCMRGAFTRDASPWLAALPALAGLLLVAHVAGFDPYDAPSLVRFADAETRSNHEWIALLAAAGLATTALQWRFRRAGSALAVPLLLLITVTYALVGAGH
jgi:hypothetical protein